MNFRKILAYLIVAAVMLTGAFLAPSGNINTLADAKKVDDIWNLAGGAELDREGDGETALTKLTIGASKTAAFNNTLAFKDFSMDIKLSKSEFSDLKFEFKSDAPAGSSESSVTNTLTFSVTGGALKVSLNGADAADTGVSLSEETYSGLFSITVTEGEVEVNGAVLGSIKEIKKYAAQLKIVNGGEKEVKVLFSQINGQSLLLDREHKISGEDAVPVIIFNEDVTSSAFFVPMGLVYNFDFDAYDVLSSTVTVKMEYRKSDGEFKQSKSKEFYALDVTDPSGDTYYIKVTATDDAEKTATTGEIEIIVAEDTAHPVLLPDGDPFYDEYQEKVIKAAFKNYADKIYLDLGSGEYYYIPSFEGMFEDRSPYANLKFNMEYNTPSSSGRKSSKLAASSLKIELTAAGKYQFRLQAIDQLGNYEKDVYSQWFSFEVENTNGPKVTAPSSNDNGFIGTAYSSNSFTIKGVDYDTVYKLQYKADDSSAWQDAEEELTNLSFTPEKLGQYKIVCTVTDKTGMSDKADTVISVTRKTRVITGEVNWAKDNILSIVFLCTGTLSLIGIIVLLLIKPSEETVEVIDKKELKKK